VNQNRSQRENSRCDFFRIPFDHRPTVSPMRKP
jgi:hypothetical protein